MVPKISLFIAILISGMTAVNVTYAKDLHVDINSTGGVCSNTYTYAANNSAQPFCTIQKAADSADPGDTILIKEGTYYEKIIITRSGQTGLPIIFKGERAPDGKWLTIIDGSDPVSGWKPATEIGAGVYKTTETSYAPYAMIADGDRNIARIHEENMTLNKHMGMWGNWRNFINTPADKKVQRLFCSDNRLFEEVKFWDGVGAYFGSSATVTYIRFRDGDDPNVRKVRSAPGPMGAAIQINDKSHIHVRDLLIRGAQWGVIIKGSLAANNIIEENHIMNGAGRVQLTSGAHDNIVRNNKMELNQLGFEEYPPRANDTGANCDKTEYSNTYSIGVSAGFYLIFKLVVGASTDQNADSGIAIRLAGLNNEITGNDIFNGVIGIDIRVTTGTRISENKIHNMASVGLYILDSVKDLYIHDNSIYDTDHNIRSASMEKGERRVYIYRNRIYNPHLLGADQYFFHFLPNSSPPPVYPEFYLYHNSIAGGNMAVGIGDAVPAGGMPKVRLINNIFSSYKPYTRSVSTVFYSSSSMIGTFDYNWVGGISHTPDPAWYGGENITAPGQYMWDDSVMPDFRLSADSPAIDKGIDLSKLFSIDGVSYNSLPGMNTGYFTGSAPDLGAYEYQGSVPPSSPQTFRIGMRP